VEWDDRTHRRDARPFAPEIVVPATLAMQQRFGASIYSSYGFLDAFNLSFASAEATG
jgi:hypothetical protein